MKAINQTFFHPCEFPDMAGKSMESDNDYENNAEITCVVYPNPTAGIISIEFSEPIENGTFEIFNVTGQMVGVFELEKNENISQIDVSYLDNGIYMYKLYGKNQVFTGAISVIKH